jgi:hypothetical protein
MTYDSRPDTQHHIDRVNSLLLDIALLLAKRGEVHDASKLVEPEKSAFDVLTPRLKGLAYGSDEYRASLRELKPALQHHYEHNSHHPEHYPNGIAGMSLLDLIEMFCDWKAAGERHATGNFSASLEHNRTRFALDDQLAAIFENTRVELGW